MLKKDLQYTLWIWWLIYETLWLIYEGILSYWQIYTASENILWKTFWDTHCCHIWFDSCDGLIVINGMSSGFMLYSLIPCEESVERKFLRKASGIIGDVLHSDLVQTGWNTLCTTSSVFYTSVFRHDFES